MTTPEGDSGEGPSQGAVPGFAPGLRVQGEVRVPTSKSIGQRLLACALIAEGETRFEALPSGKDVLHALRCAREGGARFPSDGRSDDLLATALIPRLGRGALTGAPARPSEGQRPWASFPVGESGTSARLFTAIAALGRPVGSGAEVIPSGTLAKRRSPALFRALRSAGAGVEHGGLQDGWPALLTAAAPPERLELVEPGSSQEVSALLIALASHAGHRELRVLGAIPSEGYVGITISVLERFGAVVTRSAVLGGGPGGDATRFTVRGPLRAPTARIRVEADASSAAVALAAGALSGGLPTIVRGVGLDSSQPDAAFPSLMARLGCDMSLSSGDRLALSGAPSRGGSLDCSAVPDVAPALAAVGGFLAERGEVLELTGLETLPGKESSRIDVLAGGLRAIGFEVDATDRSLKVLGRVARPTGPVTLDPEGDHRMAFAFGLMSFFEPWIRIQDPGCVSKSWPGFWRDVSASGG